jgi:hypothetical protein
MLGEGLQILLEFQKQKNNVWRNDILMWLDDEMS